MRSIAFEVVGDFPPKKDGANSMWGKKSEFDKLVALRQKARKAIGSGNPLRNKISLDVEIFYQQGAGVIGDLDNYVTGICDGLMAAAGGARLCDEWNAPDLRDVHPDKTIAIEDDNQVVSITAKKTEVASGVIKYKVILNGD